MGGDPNEQTLSENQSGLSRDSDVDGQAGPATYVAAFNTVAYPANLSAIKIEALEREEALARAQPSHIVFAADSTNDPEATRAREREAEDRADMQVGIIMQNQQWEQQREREEWSRETHSMASQTLTGKQWREIADDLKEGGAGHDWLIQYLMEHGQSREGAEKKTKDMELAASGMSKPERDRTPEEKAAVKRIDANPESKATFERFLDAKAEGFPATTEQSARVTSSAQGSSITAGADALDDQFASAPNLGDHHRAALAATEPLSPQPAAQPATISPAQQPNASAGLDL